MKFTNEQVSLVSNVFARCKMTDNISGATRVAIGLSYEYNQVDPGYDHPVDFWLTCERQNSNTWEVETMGNRSVMCSKDGLHQFGPEEAYESTRNTLISEEGLQTIMTLFRYQNNFKTQDFRNIKIDTEHSSGTDYVMIFTRGSTDTDFDFNYDDMRGGAYIQTRSTLLTKLSGECLLIEQYPEALGSHEFDFNDVMVEEQRRWYPNFGNAKRSFEAKLWEAEYYDDYRAPCRVFKRSVKHLVDDFKRKMLYYIV